MPIANEIQVIPLFQSGQSVTSISKLLGIDYRRVAKHLKANGFSMRRCGHPSPPIDHHAFADAENNPETAYWVGFFMADGCVMKSRAKHIESYTIQLTLQEADIKHVVAFQKFIKTDTPVKTWNGRDSKIGKRTVRGGRHSTIVVTSAPIGNDLIKYGVIPNKTFVAKVHFLESSRDFWRGVVDGDGFISLATRPDGKKSSHSRNNRLSRSCVPMVQVCQWNHWTTDKTVETRENMAAFRYGAIRC